MESLRLQRFKAFHEEIIIPFNNKNFLLYGENGAGKSSLYESLKYIFFKEKLESHISSSTPEDQQQKLRDFRSKYNYKIDNQEFQIDIDGISFDSFDSTGHQVFMISLDELKIENDIHLKDLIENAYLDIDNFDNLCEESFKLVQEEVNSRLSQFNESVTIEIDEQDNYAIKFVDNLKNIESKSEIKRYFNEAKINAILLLVLLSFVKLSEEKNLKKILILDDFITSLDSSNRTFIVKYIFENFGDTQLLIFTHNISFYNLIMYIINEIDSKSEKWNFANLYEINSTHKIYMKSQIERVKNIKDDFQILTSPNTNMDIESVGNRIRKKFEILLYEFSKVVMVGAVEDSKKILERITTGKSVYYHDKNTASDLIDIIQNILSANNTQGLRQNIQQAINIYRKDEFPNFQKVLTNLKLYQKVTMHPMSHGVEGMPTFTIKEIEQSITLLQKMEDFLKEMVGSNVVTV